MDGTDDTPVAASPAGWRVAALFAFAAICTVLGLGFLKISYNLKDFLPRPVGQAERYLVDTLGEDPGAQLLFAALPKEADFAGAISRLGNVAQIRLVGTEDAFELADLPEPLWQNRLLLCDPPTDEAAWDSILADRAGDTASWPDDDVLALIAADPQLCALAVLENLALTGTIPPDMVAMQVDASAFDPGTLERIIDDVRDALPAGSELFGSGAYAVDLQRTVRFEATLFSSIAGLGLALIVFWRFRSLVVMLAVAAPLLAGGAAGLAATALTFAQVHGITLAFGFTLLGIAIDYPLHLFSHRRSAGIWPTLRLGVASTLAAYAAFLFSGTDAIAQLGVFTSVGLLVAVFATGFLDTARHRVESKTAAASGLRHGPWVLLLACTVPAWLLAPLPSDDLSRLTPLPAEVLERDAALRREMSTPDLRYVIIQQNINLQHVLEATERSAQVLDALAADGVISGYQAATQLLPSSGRQMHRRQGLNLDVFERALALQPFTPQAFAPFAQSLRSEQRRTDYLMLASYADSPLAPLLDRLLRTDGSNWTSTIFLTGIHDIQPLMDAGLQVIDLKATSEGLVARYRTRLLSVVGLAAVVILILLAAAMRDSRRTLWCAGNLTAAISATAAAGSFMQDGLSLFAIMSLILVAGLGLDYTLFASRAAGDAAESRDTGQAVTLCMISSAFVFGMLWLSDVPVLEHIGSTVCIGALCAYALARFSQRRFKI